MIAAFRSLCCIAKEKNWGGHGASHRRQLAEGHSDTWHTTPREVALCRTDPFLCTVSVAVHQKEMGMQRCEHEEVGRRKAWPVGVPQADWSFNHTRDIAQAYALLQVCAKCTRIRIRSFCA